MLGKTTVHGFESFFINLFDILQDIGIVVKPNIRTDIWYRYPGFGLSGYPAGRISGKNSIRCIHIILCYFILLLYLEVL
jgi:hypothetical protein